MVKSDYKEAYSVWRLKPLADLEYPDWWEDAKFDPLPTEDGLQHTVTLF